MAAMTKPTQTVPKRFHTQVEISRAHITTLRAVILLMALVIAGLLYGWSTAPKQMTVHIPPAFQSGVTQPADTVPLPNIYTFASYIWQQLQRWPENGEKDYADNLYKLQSFITPQFYDWLEQDFQSKASRGELRGKVRGIAEIPGHHYEASRVIPQGDGVWLVWLDVEIKEWVNDLTTKEVSIRYPMRVVRFDVDREANPWGLALDGFPDDEVPTKIEDNQEEASS
jgi:integrating conjugative element protein (TIGR03746 family)